MKRKVICLNNSLSRIEAFSDGVIAIIITIMVLNVPLPETFDTKQILELLNSIFIFFVSFIIVGDQWNKHRHIFMMLDDVNNKIVWSNMLFLFCLALIPLFTKWVMQHPTEVVPVIAYDFVYLLLNFIFHLIFHNAIRMRKAEYQMPKRNDDYHFYRRFLFMLIAVLAIIILSAFYPTVSIVFFIAFPVVNVLFQVFQNRERRPRHKTNEKRRRGFGRQRT